MKGSRLWLITAILMLLAFGVPAQKSKPQKGTKKPTTQKTSTSKSKSTTQKTKTPLQNSTPKKKAVEAPKPESIVEKAQSSPADDEKKVKDMVAFLQFVLNTLGNSSTSSRDKDVLITESYSKIFRDAKVQVEDDLDEERKVITNKDVVAYLKDVDFFFSDAKFEFVIENIQKNTLATGELFYKVSLTRNLTGTTSEGQPVNNTTPRYIEINYNPRDQDLKIVSMYTNEFDEKRALANWWNELSYEWKQIFRNKYNLRDSVTVSDIRNFATLDDLDLSNNEYIQNIEPLALLHGLKSLNLAHTKITDLSPIRNLTELANLDLSYTDIQDLSPLKYSNKLVRLNLDHTRVSDISVLERMTELQELRLRNAPIADFNVLTNFGKLLIFDAHATRLNNLTPVAGLVQITILDISGTAVQDITPLQTLKNLTDLIMDSIRVRDISPLKNLENLKVLYANHTLISDLQPLQKLQRLEKIYCDRTAIKRDKADAFMAAHRGALVIFDSEDLKGWWATLTPEWQKILSTTAKVVSTSAQGPSKDELAKITYLDSLNATGNATIRDLEPIRRLRKLRAVVIRQTSVTDLSPLRDLKEIQYLDISDTGVKDISVLNQMTMLKELRADRSRIETIEPLFGLAALERVYVDHTFAHDINAREFLEKNPKCLLVYKTVHLNRWWGNLSPNWKEIFRQQMTKDTSATRENLHRLIEKESLHFKDVPVGDLSGLSEFARLKELHFSGTAITEIPPLENFIALRSLHATHSPIQKIESLSQFADLVDLDISNTPVDDLRALGSLPNLKTLNCAGTQIRRLDALEKLPTLESLDCSNTNVSKLEAISYLSLKILKCYNTKVSAREIERFKTGNPDCTVVYYR
ncbi:MAG: leucine-rich repeat domain-containing protein [Bacteroidota bacterium]